MCIAVTRHHCNSSQVGGSKLKSTGTCNYRIIWIPNIVCDDISYSNCGAQLTNVSTDYLKTYNVNQCDRYYSGRQVSCHLNIVNMASCGSTEQQTPRK